MFTSYWLRLCVCLDDFCSGKRDGLYVFPGNCSFFYRCAEEKTYVQSCPGDDIFSESRKVCLPEFRQTQERLAECTSSPRYVSNKGKGSPYSIIERRVPELIPFLAGDVGHKPRGGLPLLSARPAVTPATLKRAATNFAA